MFYYRTLNEFHSSLQMMPLPWVQAECVCMETRLVSRKEHEEVKKDGDVFKKAVREQIKTGTKLL